MSSPNQIAGALTEQAKPYGQRSGINGIFAALQDRFGISAVDAQSRLQRLFRKENTPLQDHATIVKRLARIAYSDLPETQQQHYILDDFTQSLNNIGLHHQLQAKGVTTIEAALQEGEAYLQAQQLYQATQTSKQVIRLRGHLLAATTNISPSLETEVDHLMTMLKWAMTILTHTKPMGTPRTAASRPTTLCWKCGRRGHLHSGCPQNP